MISPFLLESSIINASTFTDKFNDIKNCNLTGMSFTHVIQKGTVKSDIFWVHFLSGKRLQWSQIKGDFKIGSKTERNVNVINVTPFICQFSWIGIDKHLLVITYNFNNYQAIQHLIYFNKKQHKLVEQVLIF